MDARTVTFNSFDNSSNFNNRGGLQIRSCRVPKSRETNNRDFTLIWSRRVTLVYLGWLKREAIQNSLGNLGWPLGNLEWPLGNLGFLDDLGHFRWPRQVMMDQAIL